MKRILSFALILALGCTSGFAGEPDSSLPQETQQQLDDAISTWLTASKAPGVVVGIWIPGQGTYITAKGTDDLATGHPMRVDDHFRIGSNTKTFISTLLLQLAGEKKLSLSDPISKYLPYVPNGKHITLRMLSNMSSGLFNYTEDDDFLKKYESNPQQTFTTRQLLEVAFKHKPYFKPGKGFHYSNTNTVLLGLVIEQVTHKEIGVALDENIFKPLGMNNTSWPVSDAIPEPYAHGISDQTLDGKQADATHWNPSITSSAGSLISTLDDMHIWVSTYKGSLLTPEMQAQRLQWVKFPPTNKLNTYGLGIGYSHGWLGHEGSLPGYNSGGYYLPENKTVLVMLVNSDISTKEGSPIFTLFQAITKIISPDNVPVKHS